MRSARAKKETVALIGVGLIDVGVVICCALGAPRQSWEPLTFTAPKEGDAAACDSAQTWTNILLGGSGAMGINEVIIIDLRSFAPISLLHIFLIDQK